MVSELNDITPNTNTNANANKFVFKPVELEEGEIFEFRAAANATTRPKKNKKNKKRRRVVIKGRSKPKQNAAKKLKTSVGLIHYNIESSIAGVSKLANEIVVENTRQIAEANMHWENCEFKAELKCQNALREDPFMSVPEIASQYNFPISNLPEGTVRERTFINSRNRTFHSRIRVTPNDSDMSVSSDSDSDATDTDSDATDTDSDTGDILDISGNLIPLMREHPQVGWGGLPPRILQSALRNRERRLERDVRLARIGFPPREEEHMRTHITGIGRMTGLISANDNDNNDDDSEHDTESIGSMPELISNSDNEEFDDEAYVLDMVGEFFALVDPEE